MLVDKAVFAYLCDLAIAASKMTCGETKWLLQKKKTRDISHLLCYNVTGDSP